MLKVPATFAVSGHFCIQVMVEIAGYGTIVSQRNVDVVAGGWRPELTIPFVIRNPDLIGHPLHFDLTQWGIDLTRFKPVIRIPKPGGGDPLPDAIAAGQQLQLELVFVPLNAEAAGLTPTEAAVTTFGDVQRVDVAVRMDGKSVSGLSTLFAPAVGSSLSLPLVSK